MNKNRPCPPDFIGENHVPSRYPAPPGAPKPKFLDALDKTEADSDYSLPVKKDPKTGLLYTIPIGDEVFEAIDNEAEARRQALAEERAQSVKELEEEAKDRYAQVMAIDEVNQHRVNEEKAAREAQDNLLGDRIDRHEVKVDELHLEADRVHNSKLDKNFANAEISTLPVSSSDYIVIVSDGNTHRVTLEQLATLISQKTDYFKGQYSSLEHLNSQGFDGLQGGDYAYVDTLFTNEDGSTYYQFVTYVWDVEDARWEETKSTQYATQADYTALVQSLVDGSFNLGSVKVNSSPEESPLLKSLYVNQKHYSLPATEIEVSDEFVEGAYDMYSITFNGNTWNVPKNVVQIELSSEENETAPALRSIKIGDEAWNISDKFLQYKIGKRIYSNERITKDNVENLNAVGDIYKFRTTPDAQIQGVYSIQYNAKGGGKFYRYYEGENNTGYSYDETVGFREDYVELIEIVRVNGYRLGNFIDTKLDELESKIGNSSGGGSVKTFIHTIIKSQTNFPVYSCVANNILDYVKNLEDGFYNFQFNLCLKTLLSKTPTVIINSTFKITSGGFDLEYMNGPYLTSGMVYVGTPLNKMVEYEFEGPMTTYDNTNWLLYFVANFQALDGSSLTSTLSDFLGDLVVTTIIYPKSEETNL